MGKRGPQPTPVEILEARGSRNIKNREQPEFRPNCPPCPDYMPKRGREYWEHIVPIVSRSRVLTEADWGSLCALCLAWSEIWKAHATLEVEGRYVEGQKGNYAPHPAIHVMQMADKQFRDWSSHFGLTPSSRTGVKPLPLKAGEVKDAKERFFFAGKV